MSHYLYALIMGLIGVLFTYLDALQQHKEYQQVIYIKTFKYAKRLRIKEEFLFKRKIKWKL